MLASRQSTVSSLCRDAWVEIDLAAIESNVAVILSWIRQPGSISTASQGQRPLLMAVVKSDAYGHGADEVAQAARIAGADWLAVATVDEGVSLRQVDAKTPILILSPAPAAALKIAFENNLDVTVVSQSQIKDAAQAAAQINKSARIHLKVDTGMHRLGAAPQAVVELIDEARLQAHLNLISVFSHLAKASEADFTKKQDDCFREVLHALSKSYPQLLIQDGGSLLAQLASGDGARRFPFTHHDMVRAGLCLYGLEPSTVSDVVTPALSIRGRINQLRELQAGESVGYNLTWTATEKSRVASVPIGYADGVDRGLSNRMKALLKGKEVRQVGVISMDQMLFDVTNVPDAIEGDVVTLIGTDGDKSIQLADWATKLDTITYELACRMAMRLQRIYTRNTRQSQE